MREDVIGYIPVTYGGHNFRNLNRGNQLSVIKRYEKCHVFYGGKEEDRKANYADMVNTYYNLVGPHLAFHWFDSLHFSHRSKFETPYTCLKRHEHFIALQLNLKPGQKVLDVGCGIGGPLREISRFSLTSVIGLDNNDYQLSKATFLNYLHEMDSNYIKADFMKMPFHGNSFDAIYAIEATCHAPDALQCYKEIYRVLKPGQCFAAYERCMTNAFNPSDKEHQKIKAKIEIGCGIPDVRSTKKCLEALEQAGFEVIWEKDLAMDSPVPWYSPIAVNFLSITNFQRTIVGRSIFRNLTKALEYVKILPNGSSKIVDLMVKANDGLFEGGRREIFTPMYFFLARKPHNGRPSRIVAPKKVVAPMTPPDTSDDGDL